MRRILLFGAALLLLFTLAGCASSKAPSAESSDASVSSLAEAPANTFAFFTTNEDFSSLERYSIALNIAEGTDLEAKIRLLFKALQDPASYGFSGISVIPEGVVESIVLTSFSPAPVQVGDDSNKDQETPVAQVFVTDLYDTIPSNTRLVLRTAITQSFLSCPELSRVQIVRRGVDDSNEEAVVVLDTALSTDRMILNQYEEDFYRDEVRVTLFFANSEETGLVREERLLKLNMTDTLSMAIVRALIGGPVMEGAYPTIPDGTKIHDIVIKDGVCYVDLSQEFQMNHSGGEMQEYLTIYSLVNSLQNVAGIERVQILIEGNRESFYKNYVRIDSFLTANEELILN